MKKSFCLLINMVFLGFNGTANALTINEILQVMTAGNDGTHYNNEDENNSYTYYTAHQMGWGFEYAIYRNDPVDPSNNMSYSWIRTNATINGQAVEGKTPVASHKTYDFDENGRLQAVYNDTYYSGHNGELLETYKYAEDGQMLVYNPQGELIGAYNNLVEKELTREGFYDKADELQHLDTDGNYSVKDSNNNIIGMYYQNGDYTKNTYNQNGELLSSSKYGKDGNVKESSAYKYDGAGNLVEKYENGKLTYAKTIYTPAEAAAATKAKGNTVSITW